MNINGPQREQIDSAAIAAMQRRNILIPDSRRQRPRWFNGRFLTASDLTREQNYILTRQSDLGRASGAGVAAGLEVSLTQAGSIDSLRVSAGHGLTPAGELVLLENAVTLSLEDIPEAELLSARFGLGPIPRPPARHRSGLHVLALRPVEFSSGPGSGITTAITEGRKVEDLDIIEATAITLIPWHEGEGAEGTDRSRAAAAHAIFVEGAATRMPANVLPLAMLAVDKNTVRWIDVPMVRRELGSHRGDLPGLTPSPRSLRLAHLQQYRQHLADLLEANGHEAFAADALFPSLPPAGPLPPGAIDRSDLTQRWLPASVDVCFTIIPEDELPALLEDTLLLPPIDFTRGEMELETTSVQILAPVGRHEWKQVLAALGTIRRDLKPAAPGQIASRRPLEALMRLRQPSVALRDPGNGDGDGGQGLPSSPSESEWRRLAGLPTLWYVRCSHLARHDDLAGVRRWLSGGTDDGTEAVEGRVGALGLGDDFRGVLERATPRARLEINNLLSSPRLRASPALTAATIGELRRLERVDHGGTLRVATSINAPSTGAGLARMERVLSGLREPAALRNLANSRNWRSIDSQARVVRTPSLEALRNRINRSDP